MINYSQNRGRVDEALQAENPAFELEALVHILSKQGFTRNQIYKFFLAYQIDNQKEAEWIYIEDTVGDHPVMDILDRLVGWCNPTRTLLKDEPLK